MLHHMRKCSWKGQRSESRWLLRLLVGCFVLGSLGISLAQELENDPYILEQKFKKMEENSQAQQVHLDGKSSGSRTQKPLLLKGSVQTIDAAIQQEQASVDWYGWYMNARHYLASTGGLPCDVGTPIKFYRNGRIEPMTMDPRCLLAVEGRAFPLPKGTKLEAVILPVRARSANPASLEEILHRTQGGR